MSLVVDIEKHYGTFDLEVAFEAAHETLGFLAPLGAASRSRCAASPVSKRLMRVRSS